jgi:hypothetical protein
VNVTVPGSLESRNSMTVHVFTKRVVLYENEALELQNIETASFRSAIYIFYSVATVTPLDLDTSCQVV